ncbi:hypothetical protein SCNU_18017 [Gordonia neofelifaecis NRRL B-59395]|uniref:Acyl dehydratase n=2 Tax=Gordonia TaxID=2053 RepID=F1YNV4_9ACTN|nr:hypothetical protein SCNU_18017 [Gordonia neofelifaecis NRRL B-59395]
MPAVGDVLPALTIDVDHTMIAAGALASQDFEDVHHDPSKARARGSREVFMSINTTNGLIDRFITDWTGPAARIDSVKLRLGVPMYAGDSLALTGEVTHTEPLTVRVVGANGLGVHVRATVVLGEYGRDRA